MRNTPLYQPTVDTRVHVACSPIVTLHGADLGHTLRQLVHLGLAVLAVGVDLVGQWPVLFDFLWHLAKTSRVRERDAGLLSTTHR